MVQFWQSEKGNKEWNDSAPHGAGRLMSRTRAKEQLDMETYKEVMKEVYTTSVMNRPWMKHRGL